MIDWTGIGIVVSILVAAWQLQRATIQARTDFEDRVVEEYREIVRGLPVQALLGDSLAENEQHNSLAAFYQYFDLCNEQVFLRQRRRISKATWDNWCDGIRSHLERPAFAAAWQEVKHRSGRNFSELRTLEQTGFESDPATW